VDSPIFPDEIFYLRDIFLEQMADSSCEENRLSDPVNGSLAYIRKTVLRIYSAVKRRWRCNAYAIKLSLST